MWNASCNWPAGKNPLTLRWFGAVGNSGFKPGGSLYESQFDLAGWAIALLGDDQFGFAFQFGLIGLEGKAELIIAKQRNGPTGKVKLAFVKRSTRFESRVPDGTEPSEG